MTVYEALSVTGALSGTAAFCGVLHLAWVQARRLERKVDTLWDFQMRRAQAEAIHRGVARMNSPVVVTAEAKLDLAQALGSALGELRSFYTRFGRHLTERELWIEIERHWGEVITRRFCIPRGYSEGVCLVIAAALMRDAPDGDSGDARE